MPASQLFQDWDPVDPLSLAQAACLWEGLAPKGNEVAPSSRAYPRFRRLKNEIYTRGLTGKGFPKGYTLIWRATLREIAAATQQYNGMQVDTAKREKLLLALTREIVVWKS